MSYSIAKTLLKHSPLNVLEVDHSSLKSDRHKTLSTIADFLQVDHDFIVLETQHKQVNPGSYADKIANYDLVAKVLEKSKYAHFLDT